MLLIIIRVMCTPPRARKKSKAVITRGKIKLFRSQNVIFQRNLSRIRREII